MARTTQHSELQQPERQRPPSSGWRIGLIVAASLTTGLVVALLLVAAPVHPG